MGAVVEIHGIDARMAGTSSDLRVLSSGPGEMTPWGFKDSQFFEASDGLLLRGRVRNTSSAMS